MPETYVWRFPDRPDSAFVLHHAGKPIGFLRFEQRASTAEFEGRRWILEQSPVAIRPEDASQPAAILGREGITLPSGVRYRWTRKHIFGHTWCFRSEADEPAVCLTQQAGPLVLGGTVTVCSPSPETPILVLLAWYLRILEFVRLSESICVAG